MNEDSIELSHYFDADPDLLEVNTDHYPHFRVDARGNHPRGFAFARDPAKDATFLALAAVARDTGRILRVHYTGRDDDNNAILGVTKVEIDPQN